MSVESVAEMLGVSVGWVRLKTATGELLTDDSGTYCFREVQHSVVGNPHLLDEPEDLLE